MIRSELMKQVVRILLVCFLLMSCFITAFAAEEQAPEGVTIITEVNEAGNVVTSAIDDEGNVFSIEDLPDFEDEDDNYQSRDDQTGSPSTIAAELVGSSYFWPSVVMAAIVVVAVIYLAIKRKTEVSK